MWCLVRGALFFKLGGLLEKVKNTSTTQKLKLDCKKCNTAGSTTHKQVKDKSSFQNWANLRRLKISIYIGKSLETLPFFQNVIYAIMKYGNQWREIVWIQVILSQQPLALQGLRLTSVSSQDSGFTSQDTLFLRPTTPSSLNIQSQVWFCLSNLQHALIYFWNLP